ncbi:MAG TPA: M15 family metallopeptidase [Acidimicrobiales bacterium]|nr:M15 family metallopeptidase [Acidimicrobiales bacterium]
MLFGLTILVVAIAAFALGVVVATPSSTSSAEDRQPTAPPAAPDEFSAAAPDRPRDQADRAASEGAVSDGVVDAADGFIPDGMAVSAFDEMVPAVGELDPDLLAALRRAATDAEADGVGLRVNSGWRSPEYQQQLLLEAVVDYGSLDEATRWVATAETSAHVSGDAVDIGPPDAADWVSEHGAAHGLCPIYRNEPWHFELRPDAADEGCPQMYEDPTDDPRMQP